MGLVSNLFGLGNSRDIGAAVSDVAEVFTVNKTKAELAAQARSMAALEQYGQEFAQVGTSWFDRFINGLNRLPRPVMALGTVGLFVFAMSAPDSFAARMRGLAFVPDPLWWLLGAVVSFYFGARELHYARAGQQPFILPNASAQNLPNDGSTDMSDDANAALQEWQAL